MELSTDDIQEEQYTSIAPTEGGCYSSENSMGTNPRTGIMNQQRNESQPSVTVSSNGGFLDFINPFHLWGWFRQHGHENCRHDGGGTSDKFKLTESTTNPPSALSTLQESFPTASKEDLDRFNKAVNVLFGTARGCGTTTRQNAHMYTQMPHCQQLESWDCGVACVQMILCWLRQDASVEKTRGNPTNSGLSERDWMLQTIGTESVWTIDLIVLLEKLIQLHEVEGVNDGSTLSRRSLSYLFCSTHLGVDTTYNGYGYYRKAFESDQRRVNQRFQEAQTMGLPTLTVKHLGLAEIVSLVSNEECVAIVLLDNSMLLGGSRKTITHKAVERPKNLISGSRHPDAAQCEGGCDSGVLRSDAYEGHYVVLCGVSSNALHMAEAKASNPPQASHSDEETYCMVIKNPARFTEVDFITPSLFEKSWRAKGTDEDIVFVVKHLTHE